MTEEEKRLQDTKDGVANWRLFGPYLSERQWGTVREDYSKNGDAWNYLTHDAARSRAYRWGEDGIAGICDDKMHLCFALSLWNGKDPILKERLFGLTNQQGNHGEDVKEYYFYLDNVPSHAYMKYLYKYPQNAFPYNDLIETNAKRNRDDYEYELLDTKIFDGDRYFDIFVEYAKVDPEDLLIQITVCNRGPERATLELLPTLWFRNTWSWKENSPKPSLQSVKNQIHAAHPQLGDYWLAFDEAADVLFCENETNQERLFNVKNPTPYVKDSINDYIVNGKKEAVNPAKTGTKAAVQYSLTLNAGETKVVRLRLSNKPKAAIDASFSKTFSIRVAEADTFYKRVTPFELPEDLRNIQRQAFSGLLWNKQCYLYDVTRWLKGDPSEPPPPEERKSGRNDQWRFYNCHSIFSMPDKWEYPWFAAWDLGFHAVTLAMIDPDFAKSQMLQLVSDMSQHPNGQIPAYEWSFCDANPPIHAWAVLRIYQTEETIYGRKDRKFLEEMFQKLLVNFTWWVNRKDSGDRNIFEGGFLGLDNIGVFDRRLGPPAGGTFEQPDGTGWMGMYCLHLLQIALELAVDEPIYEEMAAKFFEHFLYIADAINNLAWQTTGLWDDERGFYYGLLHSPELGCIRLADDTITGVVPLFAVAANKPEVTGDFHLYHSRFRWFLENRPELMGNIADIQKLGVDRRVLLSFTCEEKLRRILTKVLDESQFLGAFGVRSVSKKHEHEPFVLKLAGRTFTLDYEPAESRTGLFGGNSNWRGPIWFPLNFLLIESLQTFHYYYGDSLMIECPTGSGQKSNLWDVSTDISQRLIKIFMKDENGRRPVYGGIEKFQSDPHWKDYLFFHEYFHGDNGAGLGASNQTGWTSLVAKLIHQYGEYALQHTSANRIEKEGIGHV